MTHAFTITTDAVKKHQQEMIQVLEDHGFDRHKIARGLGKSYNYVNQIMSDANSVRFTTEQDLMLRSVCAELGRYEYMECLLNGRAYVEPRIDMETNGTTFDEIVNTVEVLGDTKKAESAGYWHQVRDLGVKGKHYFQTIIEEANAHLLGGDSAPEYDASQIRLSL